VITVRTAALPGITGVIAMSLGAAIVASLGLRFVLVTPRALSSGEEWLAIAGTTVVLGVPTAILYRQLYRWRIWIYCAVFSTASAIMTAFVDDFVRHIGDSTGIGLTPYPSSVFLPILMGEGLIGISSVVGTLIAWLLSRIVRGRIEIRSGIFCPDCNYCLAGAEEMRCSECGRVFTYEELGVTPEYAAYYRESQGKMALPIVDGKISR
jgi:hypothetical protein